MFFVVEVSFNFFLYIVFTPICFVKGGHVLLMLFVFIYYHRSFCYSISQESISGELAICGNINPQSLEICHILFCRIFQRSTTKLNITIKTEIQKSSKLIKMVDKYAQWGFI